jgi:hypothetical protein
MSRMSAKDARELLKLHRNQLRQVTTLLTGHSFKGILLASSKWPTCERCHKKVKTASHALCDCEAFTNSDFHYLDCITLNQ